MLRVNEIFGPTIQGEGMYIGRPTMFIRMQGCDYRCSWCDTPYAQDQEGGTLMSEADIISEVERRAGSCRWVTITGGNPLLQDLEELIFKLRLRGFYSAIETQGSVFQPWVSLCRSVCVSPKLHAKPRIETLQEFACLNLLSRKRHDFPKVFFKFVIFEQRDLELLKPYTMKLYAPIYIQVGNRVGSDSVEALLHKTAQIIEWLKEDFVLLGRVSAVLPQMHVLLYGNRRGI